MGHRTALTFLEGASEVDITYAELDRRARAVAARLMREGASGERAVLLYPPGVDYVVAFLGCLYAGVVAVPAYPPDPARLGRTLPRLLSLIEDADARFLLATEAIVSVGPALFSESGALAGLPWIATDVIHAGEADDWRPTAVDAATVAFLQYTSGSTGSPKGVVLTHGNLLHNFGLIERGFELDEQSRAIIWLPPYHDMGLIGGVLQPMFTGYPTVLMSPISFLQRPLRWLEAISKHRGTVSGGPNFAYDLCVRKSTPEERATLDLSSWTVAFSGAEPIRADTLDRFAEAFGPSGFRREAYYPCYGLAEATLIVSGGPRTGVPVVRRFDGRALVSSGRSFSEQQLRIVDPTTNEPCAPGAIGEIWLRGESVAQGYFRRADESEAVFGARIDGERYLRTGDLGFLDGEDLFIAGRCKDLIILRGKNHYPQDIERTVETSHSALRAGCAAAFSVDAADGEQLVVVCEVDPRRVEGFDDVFAAVHRAVAEEHELQPAAVVLLGPGQIAKTSSGKIQRRACRDAFVRGDLQPLASWKVTAPEKARAGKRARKPKDAAGMALFLALKVAKVVGVDPEEIDVDVPVTQYGLDSIQSIELLHAIETDLGAAPALSSLLQGATIGSLAADMERWASPSASPSPSRSPSPELAPSAASPLSEGQRALWFLHELMPESSSYAIARAVRITTPLDVATLKAAFQALVDRHAALRTTFESADGEPRQCVHAQADVAFAHEVRYGSDEGAVQLRLQTEVRRPFDVGNGPLFRVLLLSTAPDEHVLLLVVHHLVSDLWSLTVMLDELGTLYTGGALPPLATTFQEHALGEARWLASNDAEQQFRYWEKELGGSLPELNLCARRGGNPSSQRAGSEPFTLDEGLSRALEALAGETGSTVFTVLLTAFQALLHRYTGERDLVVGMPTSGRRHAGLSPLVGYFVNPLALRVQLDEGETFDSLLRKVRSKVTSALEHQDYPFARLVERLAPRREAGRSPIFQVMFSLQRGVRFDEAAFAPFAVGREGGVLDLHGLHVESMPPLVHDTPLDLTLNVARGARGLVGSFEYNADRLDGTAVARMAGHFTRMLAAAIADPHRALGQLPLLGDEEYRQLAAWNDTAATVRDVCIHEWIERQAAKTPDAVAVEFGEARVTYAELDARAEQLAQHLLARGVGPEELVAIALERSVEVLVAVLAVMKAGGTYVPVDPHHPKERIAFVLADCGARVIITQARLRERLPASEARTVFVDRIDRDVPVQPLPVRDPGSLAYVLYTSGSTGRPKGVQVSHRAVVNLLAAMQRTIGLVPGDRLLAVTTLAFDIAALELYWPLTVGARVILADERTASDAELLLARLGEATVMQATPSTWRMLVQSGMGHRPSLKVLCGGEALPPDLAHALHARAGGGAWNVYGPTETTIWSTAARLGEGPVVIGRPLDNTTIHIVNEHFEPVPVGISGELMIGGAGLARGYLGRPELTAERFLPDAFDPRPGSRLYRTGDIARFLPSGDIECLGRRDGQVKIRGFRIELGEVEAALRDLPQVNDAVAVTDLDPSGTPRLVAYWVPGVAGAHASAAELREPLGQRLPDYMVPAVFVALDTLPLTPNGKVDRAALPAVDEAIFERDVILPRTEAERTVARAFAELLGNPHIGATDDFWHLGGHSLLATRLVSRLRANFRVELPLQAIFEARTVERLARAVESARSTSTAGIVPRGERGGAMPLSFAQERLWFLEQLAPGSPMFNMPAAVRLRGVLHREGLIESLREVIQRHETLRTAFVAQPDGRVLQHVMAAPPFDVPLVDVGEASLKTLALRYATEPFDLATAPLLRAALVRLGPEEHVLLLTVHHMVSDGWSMGIMLRELVEVYSARAENRPARLADLPVQYADVATATREAMTASVVETQLAYWRTQLEGAPPSLDLPSDRARPPVQTYRGARHRIALPPDLTARLRALGLRHEATLFMTCLAAFSLLVSRYAVQRDVVVGVPLANRGCAEAEGLIGHFVNLLPVRTQVDTSHGFTHLLQRTRERALGVYAHQDVPFERLVDGLGIERDPSRSPIFQVVFSLEPAPLRGISAPGLSLEIEPTDSGSAKFDFELLLEESENGLEGWFEYNTDLFDASSIARLATSYRVLLEAIVENPERAMESLPLLAPEQRQQLVVDFNRTAIEWNQEGYFADMFERQVERTPSAIAATCEGESLTYAELDARANRVANALRARGIGPERIVAILHDRDLEFLVAMLGLFKSGIAYVPLDPALPAARLGSIVEDCRCALILCGDEHAELGRTLDGGAGRLSSVEALVQGADSAKPSRALHPRGLAYVIFTSGSTGTPKGAMLEHVGMKNHLLAKVFDLEMTQADVVAEIAVQSFDVSIWQFVSALLVGGRTAIFRDDSAWDPARLLAQMARDGVTILETVPAHMKLMVEELEANPDAYDLSALRWFIVNGEALPSELCVRWFARVPHAKMINAYGATECSDDTAHYKIETAPVRSWAAMPINGTLPNLQVYILDLNFEPVPIGVAGEMFIGGVGVGRGYLGDPVKTARAFLPDPFSEVPGSRMYRIGDRVRYLEDGSIEFLGRTDHQVKIRGIRVEIGEIESLLGQHPDVADCAVIVRDDGGEKRLVAYVVSRDAEPSPKDLTQHLRDRMSSQVIPSAYVFLDALPLTLNGKVDRRALPAPDANDAATSEEYVAPQGKVQEQLAELFGSVLGRPRVGANDDFFDLGGHSLLATQLASRVRAAFQIELPLQSLFQAPTVEELAAVVESKLVDAGRGQVPFERVARDGDLPLSFSQERLWFFAELEPESPAYNTASVLRLSGMLDVAALKWSFAELVARHEILRTTFEGRDGRPVQRIAAFDAQEILSRVSEADLSMLEEGPREAELARRMREDAGRPFALAVGPLYRATLYRLGDVEHALAITFHHIVTDAWSAGVVARELGELYAAFTRGQPSQLPKLAYQYADYATWQRRALSPDALESQLGYWREQLANAPLALELPTDRPRPPAQTYRGARRDVHVPLATAEALATLAKREGSTLFMTVLAGFHALLARLSGQRDVVVGTLVANRTRPETEPMMGFFVNALPVRADLSADPSFAELVRQVRERSLGAFAHQDVPFEKMVDALAVERHASRAPIFQVMLVLQNLPVQSMSLPGLALRREEVPTGYTTLDLTLFLTETETGLTGTLEYSTELFDEATMARFARHLNTLLAGAAEQPELRLSELPLLTADEQHEQLVTWNDSARAVPENVCLPALFEAQAARTPTAVAAVDRHDTLSFRALNEKANRLAWQLAELGVGPGRIVALLAERSNDFLVAVLAVLKAGGAYLPLDPRHPAHRYTQVLGQSQAPWVLVGGDLRARLEPALAMLPGERPRVLGLEELLARPGSLANVPQRACPGDLAYVIYTSGSTGLPKGAMVEHRGMLNHIYAKIADLGLTREDRVAQTASQCFDISVWQFLVSLVTGGAVHVYDDEVATDPGRLLEAIEQDRITILETVPSVLRTLLAEPARRQLALRWLVPTGEALPPELARRWLGEYPSIPLLNAYGPTECSDDVTHYAIHEPPPDSVVHMPIGRPVANMRIYLLDAHLQPVPVGVPGELYVGGIGVGRGYLHDPERTAIAFVPDPFGSTPGARLYRTFDVARYLPDGNIEFLGRADHQVKVRGYRIELGEIEACLVRQPGVREAVVVVRDEQLVGYWAAAPGTPPEASILKAALAQTLPEYMVPAVFMQLEALPLTPNGKIDRKALPAPVRAEGSRSAAPSSPAERQIAALWRELLGAESVGREDSFFELGGHSLLATQLMSRIRRAFDVDLPLRALFDAPTVAGLARAVELHGDRSTAETQVARLVRRPRTGPLPLSFAQQRLWFLEQLTPGDPSYNMPIGVRLAGPLDRDALEASLEGVVHRHESLRTRFVTVDGKPAQIIEPAQPLSLPVANVASEADVAAMAHEQARAPFDLARGPLFRVRLLRLSATEHVLLVTMHHIVSDGWSLDVLVREVASLYEGNALPELEVQYADFAAWQRAWLSGERLEAQLAYWRTELSGAPPMLALPTDHVRPAEPSYRGATVRAVFSADLTARLKALSHAHGTTLFITLLAAFQALLARYTAQEDIVVGSPIANRHHGTTEGLIGFFVNSLALRAHVSRETAFQELLGQVRERVLGAHAHQDLPFEKLVEELNVPRDMRRTPLFQVMFLLDTPANAPLGLTALRVTPFAVHSATSKFDLTVTCIENDGRLEASMEYAVDLFEAATAERILDAYRLLLEGVAADPARAMGDIDLAGLESLGRVREESPARPAPAASAEYVAPRTPLEQTLAAIWAEAFGLGRVGVEDDFFELGGHSLLATQVISRIRSALDVDLTVRTFFEASTIANLAVYLESLALAAAPESGTVPSAPELARTTQSTSEAMLAKVDELSDEEVARLLRELEAEERSAGE
ncbi:non-ribosomal peptide synthase/polyketide synthase [Pendulispora brunnea]|uniref:Non-ribosomal peptide synthase/polyketide synthase n=2 Tax=Pendulispora brunnea TaxID=2905690 RepID=A0ABZ2KPT8_9BACT